MRKMEKITMKNVENYQLKKCIFMELDDYEELINKVTDGLKRVECKYDGIYYEYTEKAKETETYWNEHITETLSKYFDVTVTSVYIDDCKYLGVWICYIE